MEIVNPRVEEYLRSFAAHCGRTDPVLLQMETEAWERGFPIVERLVGVTLEVLARSISARRIFELGSGFGYSAYWFSRAIGPRGELHLTDTEPENERKALNYLGKAGLGGPVRFHVGDALVAFEQAEGDFDLVFCDIDKGDYPKAWTAASDRVRPGGMYLADNVLWSGRVAEEEVTDDVRPGWTEAIREHNRRIAADRRYLSTIIPIRDGLMVALRLPT